MKNNIMGTFDVYILLVGQGISVIMFLLLDNYVSLNFVSFFIIYFSLTMFFYILIKIIIEGFMEEK